MNTLIDKPRSPVQPAAQPATAKTSAFGLARLGIKWLANALAALVALVPALLCRLEACLGERDDLFAFFGQCYALLPGLPGKVLRRAFYCLTLKSCSWTCDLGFLVFFSDRQAEIGERVYIGPGSIIATATIGDGCLIGSRVSILSGGRQHTFGPDGKLTPFNRANLKRIHLGPETWIGEGAILMADVGSQCIIAAGSIVAAPVKDGCLVGGNPARYIRRTVEADADA